MFAAARDGIDREAVDHLEDVSSYTFSDLQNPSQRFRCEHRGVGSGRGRKDTLSGARTLEHRAGVTGQPQN